MGKQLTTQNATITTAAVEVKTLTISGKQVTLAVFRQMEEAGIIQPLDARLAGAPWGRVNYHPDKCADHDEHLHVVWEKAGELRRAKVYEPSVAAHQHLHAGLYVEARIAGGMNYKNPNAGHIADSPIQIRLSRKKDSSDLHIARFIYRGVQFQGPVRLEFARAYLNHFIREDEQEGLWHKVRHVAGSEATAESVAEQLPALAYMQAWHRLKESPQLFIAV